MKTATNQEKWILLAGILVRVVTFFTLNPHNHDWHFGVILEIVREKSLVLSNVTDQSYHPQLYHLIGAILFAFIHRPKVVQAFSLFISISTFVLVWRLFVQKELLPSGKARFWVFGLTAFHPQWIYYTLYISNDTLSAFVGVLWFNCVDGYFRKATALRALTIGGSVALGLATKATFLLFLPITGLLVVGKEFFGEGSRDQKIRGMAVVLLVMLVSSFGAYKFLENQVAFGRMTVTPFDIEPVPDWITDQRKGRAVADSYFSFDLPGMIRQPLTESRRDYPTLLYSSFWFDYLPVHFRSSVWPYYLLGSVILIVSICPSILIATGFGKAILESKNLLGTAESDGRKPMMAISVVVVVLNLSMLVLAEFRYGVWSIMHSRLMLPSLIGILLFMAIGYEWTEKRSRLRFVANVSLGCLLALFIAQIILEWGLVVFTKWH